MSSMHKIENWDGTKYTLEELQAIVDASRAMQVPFSEMVDGDGATSAFIIQELIKVIEEQDNLIE